MPKMLRSRTPSPAKNNWWEGAGARLAVIVAVLAILNTVASPVWSQYTNGNQLKAEQVEQKLTLKAEQVEQKMTFRVQALETGYAELNHKLDRIIELEGKNGNDLTAATTNIANIWAWVDPKRPKEGK